MAEQGRTTLKSYFETGDKPTQVQFEDLIDSVVNISDDGTPITNLVEDTTPQLGGNLDLNSNDITGTGNIDITGSVTVSGEFIGDLNGYIRFTGKNTSGGIIEKGQVIYISGLSGNTPEVDLARADSLATMPAYGIAISQIADNNNGEFATFGSLKGLNISNWGETGISFNVGDVLYISATEAGRLTNVAPTGESNFIQNIGKLERATPTSNTTIKVGGAGRSNATPNLNNGNIFIGNASNQASTTAFAISLDTTPQLGGNLDLNGNNIGDATAADLTKLNEVTATSTELNYVDGVTSAIQTQLDAKVQGPANSSDDFIAVFNGATGKIIKTPSTNINANNKTITNARYVLVGTEDSTTDLAYGARVISAGTGPVFYLKETDTLKNWAIAALSSEFIIRNASTLVDVITINQDNLITITGDADFSGDLTAATIAPDNGATGSFTTTDGKTVTVTNGIITNIV